MGTVFRDPSRGIKLAYSGWDVPPFLEGVAYCGAYYDRFYSLLGHASFLYEYFPGHFLCSVGDREKGRLDEEDRGCG